MIIYKTAQPKSHKGNSFLKAAIVLTIAVFLIIAPALDSSVFADMTSNFIVVAKNPALEP